MDFGYFTLSDNRYPGNTRSAEPMGRIGGSRERSTQHSTLSRSRYGVHRFF